MTKLIKYTNKGFYCEQGNFFIDPQSSVENALITHAHSDHAIRGHTNYLSHYKNIPILKTRLSKNLNISGVEYGEKININGVQVSFFPSGHTVGSAQIRVENSSERWVFSGDYKIGKDNISTQFVPIECDYFVTETTFAQPIFRWESQEDIFSEMNLWINQNKFDKRFSVILCYSLGKAQRILKNLQIEGKIFVDNSIFQINKAIEAGGTLLPEYNLINFDYVNPGDLLLASHSFLRKSSVARNLYYLAEASGWMAIQSPKGIDKKFVLSDHADWNGLNFAVRESKAKKIFTNHGFTKTYTSWLRKKGYDAYDVGELEIE